MKLITSRRKLSLERKNVNRSQLLKWLEVCLHAGAAGTVIVLVVAMKWLSYVVVVRYQIAAALSHFLDYEKVKVSTCEYFHTTFTKLSYMFQTFSSWIPLKKCVSPGSKFCES